MFTRYLHAIGAAALLTVATFPTNAAPAADMFPDSPKSSQPGDYATQAISGKANVDGLSAGRRIINFQLPDGSKIKLERTGFEARENGDALWIGIVADDPDSEAVLTIVKGKIAGRVRIGAEVFEILPGKGNQTIIQALDLNALPACDVDESHKINSPLTSSAAAPTGNDGSVVNDILVVYTANARTTVGDTNAMNAYIQGMIDTSNTAFNESNMDVRFRLVHAEEIAYTTAGSTSADLSWVRTDPGVAALRDQYGADMVTILVDTPNSCGTAYIQNSPASWFEAYAFAASDVDCALGGLTFSHEHGHNMGMEHNPENSDVGGDPSMASYNWSFGHYVDGSYRTVMSYSNPCTSGCSRVARFSNPDIDFNGAPTGISNTRDNAQTGDLTAPIIADFRATVVTDPSPGPIVDVRISQPSDDAEESVLTGTVYLHSNDLEIGYDGAVGTDVDVGLRFTNIDIPNGATITSAYLEFTADEVRTDTTNATIRGEADDNPVSFNALNKRSQWPNYDICKCRWNIPAWSAIGDAYQSPDISGIVQEIVDRGGWTSGNAMAFIIEATGRRNAHSWDGEPLLAPLLHVEYETVQTVTIDVLPGDPANQVYPNMAGILPVAVLSSATFDASQIHPNTLVFGVNEATPATAVEFLDLDSQHTLDAQTRFSVPETGIACNDTEVSLSGETLTGDAFTGTDTIDATQCASGGCHAY